MSCSVKRFKQLVSILIIGLLLSISLVGSFHHHRDGLNHPDCFMCVAYSILSISFAVAAVSLVVLTLYLFLPQTGSPAFCPKLLVFRKTSRSPPLC